VDEDQGGHPVRAGERGPPVPHGRQEQIDGLANIEAVAPDPSVQIDVVVTRRPGHRFDQRHGSAGGDGVGDDWDVVRRCSDAVEHMHAGVVDEADQEGTGLNGDVGRRGANRTQRAQQTVGKGVQVAVQMALDHACRKTGVKPHRRPHVARRENGALWGRAQHDDVADLGPADVGHQRYHGD